MAQIRKNRRLGLSFGSEDHFLVETEKAANSYKITSLLDVSSDIPYSTDMIMQESGAEMIGTELKNVLSINNIKTRNLSISLDLGIGNIVKIPFSKKLSDKELPNHLTWELQQYIDENVEQYAFDSYKLLKSSSVNSPELILVGTRKKVLTFFQEVSRYAEVDLELINVDILSVVNAFEANYKLHPRERIALVEIGERKLVFSLLEGNCFIGYHHIYLDDSVHRDYLNSVLELITLNLKTLFSDYDLSTEKNDFDHVFLHRSNAKYDIKQLIEAADQELNILNPFEKIRVDSKLHDQIDFSADNSQYVEALGLTVRK
jgi:Tfp pilus assembly PilM family ATPase